MIMLKTQINIDLQLIGYICKYDAICLVLSIHSWIVGCKIFTVYLCFSSIWTEYVLLSVYLVNVILIENCWCQHQDVQNQICYTKKQFFPDIYVIGLFRNIYLRHTLNLFLFTTILKLFVLDDRQPIVILEFLIFLWHTMKNFLAYNFHIIEIKICF